MRDESPGPATGPDPIAAPSTSGPRDPSADTTPTADDLVRRTAALRLAQHLNTGVSLLKACEDDPTLPPDQRLKAVQAAARLINANAHLGRAIGYLSQVERRSRAIVQTLPAPASKHSNSIPVVSFADALQKKMMAYMTRAAEEVLDPGIVELEEEIATQKAEAARRAARKEEAEPQQ